MGNKSNHFYIDESLSNFFNNSTILNLESTEKRKKRDIFVLVAAYGFSLGFPFSELKRGSDIFVMNQLEDDQLAILYSIAIAHTNDPEVILDDMKVANITMRYASRGLKELKKIEENTQYGNRFDKFRKIIRDAIKSND